MSAPSPGSNPKNTAIKRIQADVRELSRNPSSRYYAEPLEDNMFEWHFTIRGPPSTDFENGIYHGRILLPADYPFKPPNFIFLTKNGRFEVGTKVCLSISAHHPEAWQPAWGIRTMLEAIISFLPTEANGAIGGLDWSPEERRKLAEASSSFVCPHCGEIKEIIPEGLDEDESLNAEISAQISQLHMHNVAPMSPTSTPGNTPNNTRQNSFVGDNGMVTSSHIGVTSPPPANSMGPDSRTADVDEAVVDVVNSGGSMNMNEDSDDLTANDTTASSSSSSSSTARVIRDVSVSTNENQENVNTGVPNVDMQQETPDNDVKRASWTTRNGIDGCLAFFQYLTGIIAVLLLFRRLAVEFAPLELWPEYPFNPAFIRLMEQLVFEDSQGALSSSSSDSSVATSDNNEL